GTSVVSAIIVDIARLMVYGVTFFSKNFAVLQDQIGIGLVTAATITAFLGSFIGSRLIKKITMHTIQIIVGVLLLLVSLAMAVGLI
ncbi:MAG: sulfite exporter TauE/SafE family protein, partial [Candidatus Jettenia sp.]|nr:sulfite exporter TauE/SafE family protein [Candidatus Jettenia sp.]